MVLNVCRENNIIIFITFIQQSPNCLRGCGTEENMVTKETCEPVGSDSEVLTSEEGLTQHGGGVSTQPRYSRTCQLANSFLDACKGVN